MKTVALILFLAIGCLAIIANSSPVPDGTTDVTKEDVSSRQAAAPAASAVDEDDDDDDDDDDALDIGDLDDDDDDDEDDDEEADDDDDDEDYLERIIGDLLGADDDDDDDDDETPAVVEPIQPASPVQTQSPLPTNVQSDFNAEDAAIAAEAIPADVNDSTGSYEEDDSIQPQEQAASTIEGGPQVIVNQPALSAPSQNVDSDEEDDDDDDDDDDIDLDLTEDDDSDEDDDEEDDADDETDALEDIVDIADARRARAMEGDSASIYVAKYNRFVDNILGKINKILRENYDPVTVKLTRSSVNSNKSKVKRKKNKTKGKSSSRDSNVHESTTTSNSEIHSMETSTIHADASTEESRGSRPSGVISKDSKPRRTATKNKKKTTSKGSNKQKVKQTKQKSKSKTKATLYGLSSLKRSGDVSVNIMSDHTTIKTKFNLGPLILQVEKEFGKAAKKELRNATATTAEMSGKLSLRVLHGGAATLHSIRVSQPKQVRVDSPDDHDRTREFVWRRSSHIAHLVSQKLSSATKSMLRPPPAATA